MTLEQRLAEKLNEQAKSAGALGIPAPKRLLQQAAQYGAADAVFGAAQKPPPERQF